MPALFQEARAVNSRRWQDVSCALVRGSSGLWRAISGAFTTSVIIAAASAPAARTSGTVASVIPPIATIGSSTAARTARRSLEALARRRVLHAAGYIGPKPM